MCRSTDNDTSHSGYISAGTPVFTPKVMHEECNVATQGVEVERTCNANKKYAISNNVP